MNVINVVTVLLVLANCLFGTMACPESCNCFHEQGLYSANCTSLPPNGGKIETLNLVPRRQTPLELSEGQFTSFKHLKYLNLSNCSIYFIHKKAFYGVKSIVEIDLSFNFIEDLEPTVFQHINDLTTVILRGNRLHFTPNTPFLISNSIQHLDIGLCGIRHIPRNVFYGVKRIMYMALDGNSLQSVRYNSLPRGLKYLNLSNNHIVNVPIDLLSTLGLLRRLDLSGNPINCTCALLNMQDWFSGRGVTFDNDVVCASPPQYAGISWSKVNENDLCIAESLKEDDTHAKVYPKMYKYGLRSKDKYFANEKNSHFEADIQSDQPQSQTDPDSETLFQNDDTLAMGEMMQNNDDSKHFNEISEKGIQPRTKSEVTFDNSTENVDDKKVESFEDEMGKKTSYDDINSDGGIEVEIENNDNVIEHSAHLQNETSEILKTSEHEPSEEENTNIFKDTLDLASSNHTELVEDMVPNNDSSVTKVDNNLDYPEEQNDESHIIEKIPENIPAEEKLQEEVDTVTKIPVDNIDPAESPVAVVPLAEPKPKLAETVQPEEAVKLSFPEHLNTEDLNENSKTDKLSGNEKGVDLENTVQDKDETNHGKIENPETKIQEEAKESLEINPEKATPEIKEESKENPETNHRNIKNTNAEANEEIQETFEEPNNKNAGLNHELVEGLAGDNMHDELSINGEDMLLEPSNEKTNVNNNDNTNDVEIINNNNELSVDKMAQIKAADSENQNDNGELENEETVTSLPPDLPEELDPESLKKNAESETESERKTQPEPDFAEEAAKEGFTQVEGESGLAKEAEEESTAIPEEVVEEKIVDVPTTQAPEVHNKVEEEIAKSGEGFILTHNDTKNTESESETEIPPTVEPIIVPEEVPLEETDNMPKPDEDPEDSATPAVIVPEGKGLKPDDEELEDSITPSLVIPEGEGSPDENKEKESEKQQPDQSSSEDELASAETAVSIHTGEVEAAVTDADPSSENKNESMVSSPFGKVIIQAKPDDEEQFAGAHVVLFCIVVLVASLILLSIYKCRVSSTNSNRRPPKDVEASHGTEMQDMASLLPKPLEEEKKTNLKYPNEAPTSETVKLIAEKNETPIYRPPADTTKSVDKENSLNNNAPSSPSKTPLIRTATPITINPAAPIQRTKVRVGIIPESIPRTPIFVQKTYNNGIKNG